MSVQKSEPEGSGNTPGKTPAKVAGKNIEAAAYASAEESAIMVAAVRAKSENYASPSIAPIGTGLLIAIAIYLVLSQMLYPYSVTGMDTGLRDMAFGIPLGLAAMALRSQMLPHAPALVVCALIGVGLVLCGALAPHNNAGAAFGEVACGVLIFIACLTHLDKRPTPQLPPD